MGEREEMIEKDFVLQNEVGLHARPAAKFTRIASSYKSEIRIIKGEKVGNGKSLLSILALGLFQGTKFTIKIVGPDEVEALYALTQLVENDFMVDEESL